MDHLLALIIFFILGTIALYALRAAKNVAYVIFVLMLGWGLLYYAGLDKQIPGNDRPATEIFSVFNDIFKKEAHEGIDYASKEGGEAIANSMRQEVGRILQPEDIMKTSAERMHAAAPSFMDSVKKILQEFLHAILP